MADKPFELDLTGSVADAIQCSVCGQPNVFGKLCETCKVKLAGLEAADEATRRTYLMLGLRCVAEEFSQKVSE
jgi:hypothetical protein